HSRGTAPPKTGGVWEKPRGTSLGARASRRDTRTRTEAQLPRRRVRYAITEASAASPFRPRAAPHAHVRSSQRCESRQSQQRLCKPKLVRLKLEAPVPAHGRALESPRVLLRIQPDEQQRIFQRQPSDLARRGLSRDEVPRLDRPLKPAVR